ncbi:MAG: peptidylprolyl isomerase [Planctomycetota bacterium]
MARVGTVLALLALVACRGGGGGPPVPDLPDHEVEFRAILEAECRRGADDVATLERLRSHDEPLVRTWAVRALGRLGDRSEVLCRSLADPEPEVRRAAVFALGQCTDEVGRRRAEGALTSLLAVEDPELRAAVHEALGKLLGPGSAALLRPGLGDGDPVVVGAAALALHRLRVRAIRAGDRPGADDDAALAADLRAALVASNDPDSEWRVVYTLASLDDAGSYAALAAAARSERSPWSRVFALRGLADLRRAEPCPLTEDQRVALRKLLLRALADKEVPVVVEALLGLGDPSRHGRGGAPAGSAAPFEDGEVLDAIKQKAAADNPVVAAVALRGLGHFPGFRRMASAVLNFHMASRDPWIRAQATEAAARLHGADFADQLDIAARDPAPLVRAAVARSLRFVPTRRAMPIARQLAAATGEGAVVVRLAVLEAVADHAEHPDAATLALAALDDPDEALREAGADLLARVGRPGDAEVLAAIRRAYTAASRDVDADARQALLRALGALGGGDEECRRFLERAADDPAFAVRKEAARQLRAHWTGEAVPEPRRPVERWTPHLPERNLLAFLRSRPRVALDTDRGRLVVELWPDVAPAHAWNLVQYVASGRYDGRLFHRLVPGFVLQGGDRRGDGYGALSFLGEHLRDEVGDRPFLEGTLGMPKSAEPDSGGEQVFFCLVPTPHLDGGYTSFGRVVEGFDTLRSLVVGDRIKTATVLGR